MGGKRLRCAWEVVWLLAVRYGYISRVYSLLLTMSPNDQSQRRHAQVYILHVDKQIQRARLK